MTGWSPPASWPVRIRKATKLHQLASLDGQTLTWADGDSVVVADWASLVEELERRPSIVLTNDIDRWAATAGPEVLISTAKDTRIVSVARRGRRATSRLIPWSAWSMKGAAGNLLTLQQTFEHCGVGLQATPATLWQALMGATYPYQDEQGRVTWRQLPSGDGCDKVLRASVVGGRVDTPGEGQTFDDIWEIDLNNAYASAARKLPTGKPRVIAEGVVAEGAVTTYRQCVITIPRKLSGLGPFPLRDRVGKVCYPTEAGTYTAWLWRETVEDCRKAGCHVEERTGWAWMEWTDCLSPWAERMDTLRSTAPNPDVARVLKLSIVAALGRFFMKPTRKRAVPHEKASGLPMVLAEGGMPMPLDVREERATGMAPMAPWYSYIMASTARQVWALAGEQENVIYTNFDAVAVAQRPTAEPREGLGGWKIVCLGKGTIPYPRAIVSDGKTRLPGVRRPAPP